jgi:hypothetical protein
MNEDNQSNLTTHIEDLLNERKIVVQATNHQVFGEEEEQLGGHQLSFYYCMLRYLIEYELLEQLISTIKEHEQIACSPEEIKNACRTRLIKMIKESSIGTGLVHEFTYIKDKVRLTFAIKLLERLNTKLQ